MCKSPLNSEERLLKRQEFKNYENLLNKLIRQRKRDFYNDQFTKASSDIKETWKNIKTILNKNKKSSGYPTLFKHNGLDITDPKTIANEFNKYFTNIGPELANSINTSGMPNVMSYMKPKADHRFKFEYTNPENIRQLISEMKSKNSSGEDEFSSKFLKNKDVSQAWDS